MMFNWYGALLVLSWLLCIIGFIGTIITAITFTVVEDDYEWRFRSDKPKRGPYLRCGIGFLSTGIIGAVLIGGLS